MPLRATALLLTLAVVLSGCGDLESPPPITTDTSQVAPSSEGAEGQQSKPWWEGRTWAGEIEVCVKATEDESGCQWLAGLLIHRRCELKMYQTFAAALSVGAPFEGLYRDAVEQGECQDVVDVSPAEVSSKLS